MKGSRGTPISFHEGDKGGKIVVASGQNRNDMAQDLIEVGSAYGQGPPSRIKPTATCTEENGRVVVSGQGGTYAEAISAMVDALFLPDPAAEQALVEGAVLVA